MKMLIYKHRLVYGTNLLHQKDKCGKCDEPGKFSFEHPDFRTNEMVVFGRSLICFFFAIREFFAYLVFPDDTKFLSSFNCI
jgi:hypothetical protein